MNIWVMILISLTISMSFCFIVLNLQAAPLLVTNDNGTGSLRQALADANDGNTISFGVTGTIILNTAELLVDKGITITGPGPFNLAAGVNLISGVSYADSGLNITISGPALFDRL